MVAVLAGLGCRIGELDEAGTLSIEGTVIRIPGSG